MNDEERISEFAEPPKTVKIADIRVCITEMQTAGGTHCNFMFAYPYLEEEGGTLKVFNPSYTDPNKYERAYSFSTKTLLWQAYLRVRNKSLRENPDLKIMYEGKILRDTYYEPRKFE